MKYKVLILSLFFSIGSRAESQTKYIKENNYILKGKLISEFDKNIILCGILSIATVVEFEIISFTDETYSKEIIPLIFPCPISYFSDLFKKGEIYELVLTDKGYDISNWIFLNSSKDTLIKYDLKKEYWFLNIKK